VAENSKIEWTTHTFNPWRGCTKVSAGCANCYAETLSGRNPTTLGVWGPNGTRVVAAESQWRQPLKWERQAKADFERWQEAARYARSEYDAVGTYERPRVFCASLADVFEGRGTMPHGFAHTIEAARLRLFRLIHATPNLDWLLLTKRPHLIRDGIAAALRLVDVYAEDAAADMLTDWLGGKPPANVWLGTSVEDQKAADERIPHLLMVPAKVLFLSMEPLLGPVDITRHLDGTGSVVRCAHEGVEGVRLNWVIVGGESGGGSRPMHPNWVRSIRDQCQHAGVAFFFKQWGEFAPQDAGGMFSVGDKRCHTIDEIGRLDVPHGGGQLLTLRRVGKKDAGRLLDGQEWSEFPEVPCPSASS
jgi:protein gp37